MGIKNYTTQVNDSRTIAEIQQILSSKGARCIQVDYDEKGIASAVRFIVPIQDTPISFRLPCNFEGVKRTFGTRYIDPERVRWIAWRIVKDWIDAQMAIIESNQASLAQVFLPYAEVGRDGLTVYEQFLNSHKQLTDGAGRK